MEGEKPTEVENKIERPTYKVKKTLEHIILLSNLTHHSRFDTV